MEPSHAEMVANLLGHYEASEQEGKDWYYVSRHEARRLAREHGTTTAKAAGVIAALSPNNSWKGNITLADRCLSGVDAPLGLSRSAERAIAIRDGKRPLLVLKGPKTRAFYRAIMGDEDACVIDMWMCRAAGWPRDSVSEAQYERIAAALVEAAAQTTHTPAEFQAIVWTQVRGGGE